MTDRRTSRVCPATLGVGLVTAGVLAVFLAVSLVMIRPRFISQQGVRLFKMGSPERAAVYFEQARDAVPAFLRQSKLTAADRFRLDTWHGRALYDTGNEAWRRKGISPEVYALFLRSRELLDRAAALESGYYRTAFWRAQTEHALERIHPLLFPGTPNPFSADALYVHASALRPAGIAVRQAHARYLHETGQTERVAALVQNMLEIYPPVHKTLKKERYYK